MKDDISSPLCQDKSYEVNQATSCNLLLYFTDCTFNVSITEGLVFSVV